MDAIDVRLLNELQHDADIRTVDLGKLVGLSPAGVHKRLKRLRERGLIRGTVALLDRNALGLDLLCILTLKFRENLMTENLTALERCVNDFPEVLEAYTLTGSVDAIVKVTVSNHRSLREFLRRFAEAQDVVETVQTAIVLEEVKSTSELPVWSDEAPT